MSKCYRCQSEITPDNWSKEHIILNACGGRLQSKELLCQGCNSQFGERYDKELAKQTNDLCLMLMIKRHDGEDPPSIIGTKKTSGETYLIQANCKVSIAKPFVKIEEEGKQVRLSILAKDEEKFREILNGIKKKYPGLDIEQVVQAANHHHEYMDEALTYKTSIGGDLVFKSILKTSINYFILNGGERKYIQALLPYLENELPVDFVRLYYPYELIYVPSKEEVSHVIKIVGNNEEKILYVYVELFNVHCYLVKLSENYEGQPLNKTYIYDLIEIKEVNKNVELNFSRPGLLELFETESEIPVQEVLRRYRRVLSVADKRQYLHVSSKLVQGAIEDSFGKYPEGTIITEEILEEYKSEFLKRVVPFIAHKQRGNSGMVSSKEDDFI